MAEIGDLNSFTPSRHEKSLGLLTTKFVTLLEEAEDGVLDLKVVGQMKVLMLQWWVILYDSPLILGHLWLTR